MQDDRLQERLNKMARPSNCEALTKVTVNQLAWDNLSSDIRSQDIRMQKVQTSLIKGLTGVVRATDKMLSCLDGIPIGNNVIQLLSRQYCVTRGRQHRVEYETKRIH